VVAYLPLHARGSVADWVDSRRREIWLHEILQERDAPEAATNGCGNTSSVQTSNTGPIYIAANINGQDGQAAIDESVVLTNPLTATNTNTPTSTLIHSTYSSASMLASDELSLPSQTVSFEEKDRNQASARISEGDGVGLEMQQLTPALIHGNMAINIAPLATDTRNSEFLSAPGASLPAEANGIDEKLVEIYPVTNVGMDTQGNHTEETMPTYPCTVPDTVVK